MAERPRSKTQKLSLMALLTAMALGIFMLEAQLPSPVPIPGIKLGLANIITLTAMLLLGRKEAGAVLLDGSGTGEVGSVVMRDRHKLAEDGMIVIVMSYSSYDHRIIGEPEIVTHGFIYVKEAEDLLAELKRVTMEAVESCEEARICDWSTIKSKVKSSVSGYLYRTANRSPMILPVISEV